MRNRIKLFILCLLLINSLSLEGRKCRDEYNHFDLVTSSHRIILKEYPQGWNPSLVEIDDGYLLCFRYTPNIKNHWMSYVGLCIINNSFEQEGEAYLLTEDCFGNPLHPHMEDARLFRMDDRIYLVFNCCTDKTHTENSRRDMWVGQIVWQDDKYMLMPPVRLLHSEYHEERTTEKNWVAFSWGGMMLFSYSINPHEVIVPILATGECVPVYETKREELTWKWGPIRGGTPAVKVDDHYLAFFHSSINTYSIASIGERMHHYYMGAYTFSADPPFEVTRTTPFPVVGEGFYTRSDFNKRVIFPGGLVVQEDRILVSYGKDDREIWIAVIDKVKLYEHLKPVE